MCGGHDLTEGADGLAIRAEALVRRFGDNTAVDGVDLAVPRGMVYGLLGPNGAGKTTTIRMLATLLRPDAGTAWVLGHDVVREADAVRGRVSLTGQFASVDEDLTGLENLVLIARLLGYSRKQSRVRASELLDAFGLSWIWTALGLVLRTPNSVMGVSMMVLFPLTFASNIFVEPRTMPPWLEVVVGANPITHLVTAVRGLMHGTATAGQIGWVLLTSGVLVAVFAPLTMYLYRNKK